MRVASSAGTTDPRVARAVSVVSKVLLAPAVAGAGHSVDGAGAVDGAPPMCAGGEHAAMQRARRERRLGDIRVKDNGAVLLQMRERESSGEGRVQWGGAS